MENPTQPASNEKRLQFLLVVLEAEEKRRVAIENKSRVLSASNALLMNAIIWLGGISIISGGPIRWYQLALIIIALGSATTSVILTAQTIKRFTPKQRGGIIGLGPNYASEHNLFYFGKVARFNREEYQREIDLLTEREFLQQLTSQVYNLSQILWRRYGIMDWASHAFVAGMVAVAILAVTIFLFP